MRIERLQAYIARLQAFKQNSATKLSHMSGELRKSLPPPPFIVFAVVEELLRSDYAPQVHSVPGEADPYVENRLSAFCLTLDALTNIFLMQILCRSSAVLVSAEERLDCHDLLRR